MFQHLFAFTVALGFTAQAGEKVSEQAVIAFNGKSFRFGWSAPRRRNESFIGSPVIGHNFPDSQQSYRLPEFLFRCCVPRTQYAVDEASPISINSNPNPAIGCFNPM